MPIPMYLLKQTRVNLLQKAMERGYANPLITQRARGLSEFLNDLAQRSFTIEDTQAEPDLWQEDRSRLTRGEQELTIKDYIHKVDTLTLSTAQRARPKRPTTTLNINGLALARYVDDMARKQLHLDEPFPPTHTNFKLASDVINLIGYGVLVPGAWPDRVQPEVHRPHMMIEAYVSSDDLMSSTMDIYDRVSVSVSDSAWDLLVERAQQQEYIAQLISPGNFERKRAPLKMKGISNFLTVLADCHFVDDRPSFGPEYLTDTIRTNWNMGEVRKQRLVVLSQQTLEKYVAIAKEHKVFPPQRFTSTSITSVVLEAIGCELLVPTAWPMKFLTHGPSLVPVCECPSSVCPGPMCSVCSVCRITKL